MALIVDIEKQVGGFFLKVRFQAGTGVLSLLGASGSGKSMTLKCIAGIEKPDRGYIELDGRVLFDSEKGICLPPQERRAGYLFQQYALFPHMTVWKNIQCGILGRDSRLPKEKRTRKSGKAGSDELIAQVIRKLHLEGLEDKLPARLSGGEQQRTALARILVNDPEVLLLDEPFSALDAHLRFHLEQELRTLLRQFDRPVLLVSHDRDEVYRLADRVAVIRDGTIETLGTKHDVFSDPGTVAAARLTGCKNISPAQMIREQTAGEQMAGEQVTGEPAEVAEPAEKTCIFAGDWGVRLCVSSPPPGAIRDVSLDGKPACTDRTTGPSDDIKYVGLRMHDARIPDIGEAAGENCFVCRVIEEIENPFSYTILVRPLEAPAGSVPVGIELDKKKWRQIRACEITVCFPPEKLLLLR